MRVSNNWINSWPFFIATLILVSMMLVSVREVKIRNNGHFGYALDDTYIHMSIARNVESHGVYGITKNEFTSSSSSPIWTFLLSILFYFFGVNEAIPFTLNLILSVILLRIIFCLLSDLNLSGIKVLLVLLSVIFFTPLHALIFGGMEHVLHSIFTLLFVYLLTGVLIQNKSTSKRTVLLAVAPLLTSCRYEGFFLIFIACSLLCLRKKIGFSILLLISSTLPIVTLGLISLHKGWFFLPATVLIKGQTPTLSITGLKLFLINGMERLVNNPHLLILMILSLIVFVLLIQNGSSLWTKSSLYLFIFIQITILHLLFAQIGWVYRYEAYLVVLGLFSIIYCIGELFNKGFKYQSNVEKSLIYLVMIIFMVVIMYPLVMRGYRSYFVVQQGVKNVYEQQYQMGLFVNEFYKGKSVALNDIGAVVFLSDIICTDLMGLGNIEIARARKNNTFSTMTIDQQCKTERTKIAIVYDEWFQGKQMLPKQWIKAGEWTIEDNRVCGSKTVSFYAVDSMEINRLSENLKQFSVKLPGDVKQEIY